jgi:putative phage-type endonuclease
MIETKEVNYLDQITEAEPLFVKKEGDEKKWISTRRYGIGGSEVGTVCRINPYSSIMDLYEYKVNGTRQEFTEDAKERMHFGTILEDIIAKEFARRNYVECAEITMLKNKKYPFCLANIDRLIIEDGEVKAILECKTAGEYAKEDWINGDISLSYIYQVQWYMFITGIHKAYIAGLIGGQTYVQHEILYDQDLIYNELLPEVDNFWCGNVLKEIPPVIDGSKASVDYVNNRYKEAIENTVVLNDCDEMLRELDDLKEKQKNIEYNINEIQNKIKMAMEGVTRAETNNYKISWHNRERESLDSDKLKADGIYAKYTKKTTFRVFSTKIKK